MSHAGDVSPQQAWDALSGDPDAVLVDVRTHAERTYVGVPDLSGLGRHPVSVEWLGYPDGALNPDFLDQLVAAGVDAGTPTYFLCRSGARSAAAASAATEAGWTAAHNVAEGFEGDLGASGHRDVNGWQVAGLPWVQR